MIIRFFFSYLFFKWKKKTRESKFFNIRKEKREKFVCKNKNKVCSPPFCNSKSCN